MRVYSKSYSKTSLVVALTVLLENCSFEVHTVLALDAQALLDSNANEDEDAHGCDDPQEFAGVLEHLRVTEGIEIVESNQVYYRREAFGETHHKAFQF